MEWQPIESAPKDGRWVLIFRDGRQYVARWSSGYETWGVSVARVRGEETAMENVGRLAFYEHVAAEGPSHWMPLPPAPTAPEPAPAS